MALSGAWVGLAPPQDSQRVDRQRQGGDPRLLGQLGPAEGQRGVEHQAADGRAPKERPAPSAR